MTLDEQIAVIVADLMGKLHRHDWHGVMDCAADIRELEAFRRGQNQGGNASSTLTTAKSTESA